MLTQTLRGLENDGLVQRHVTAEVPVRVDCLTELGQSLLPLNLSIKSWAEDHIDAVREARKVVIASEGPQADPRAMGQRCRVDERGVVSVRAEAIGGAARIDRHARSGLMFRAACQRRPMGG